MDNLYQILTFLFGATGIGTFVIKWWLGQREKRKDISTLLAGLSNIYSKMQQLLNETDANRFLILKAENGGGRPKIGSTINVSVLYEVLSGLPSIKDDYQKLPVDNEYISMLADASSHGHTSLVVSEMPPCILKDIYVAENVKYSEIHYLCETPKAFYYCSIASTITTNFSGAKSRNSIHLSVNNIKNIMKKLVK